jgi:hypothetical protein
LGAWVTPGIKPIDDFVQKRYASGNYNAILKPLENHCFRLSVSQAEGATFAKMRLLSRFFEESEKNALPVKGQNVSTFRYADT